jgi:hypothetical protein
MKNYNVLFALLMFTLMSMLFLLTKTSTHQNHTSKIIWMNIPESKGCMYPTNSVNFTKTEIRHIVPISQIHKCHYDQHKRLVKVSTYNFEQGYQMKKPTQEVLYQWVKYKLVQYSIRKASHGNGEVDVEVYRLTN